MKVYLRFLRQGLVEAEAPDDFCQWSPSQQMLWGDEALSQQSQHTLVTALSDSSEAAQIVNGSCNGFFDSMPACSAIEIPDRTEEQDPQILIYTKEWDVFAFDGNSRDLFNTAGDPTE